MDNTNYQKLLRRYQGLEEPLSSQVVESETSWGQSEASPQLYNITEVVLLPESFKAFIRGSQAEISIHRKTFASLLI